DDNPVGLTPFVTWLLILACTLVYVWEFLLGQDMAAALNVLGFMPASLLGYSDAPSRLLGVPPFVTIFTSMFLHGSVLHLAGNMLYLWIFGNNIEEAMGHFRFFIFYLISG